MKNIRVSHGTVHVQHVCGSLQNMCLHVRICSLSRGSARRNAESEDRKKTN